jgi:pSer/pThr/pTyr-binding forkhead associated (FHA) protein
VSNSEKPHSPVRLVVTRGPTKGKVIHIEEGENLIGRWDPDAGAFPEIDLDNEDIEAKISRKHAILERRGRNVFLTDIGSLNGTFVNRGQRLGNGEKHQLKHADEVIIGKTFLTLEIDS